jgi:SPOR domain
MKYLFFFFIIAFSKLHAAAITDTIVVDKDPRLDVLTAKQAMINKRSAQLTSAGLYKGYRLQVTSTVNREEAFKAKTALLNRFPEQKTYLIFQSPYFKVRIGNFLKREEADKFRKQLTKQLPQAAYIVEDTIEYMPQEEELQN